jgi:hypothetical protein
MDVIHPKMMASMPHSAPRTLIALSMFRYDLVIVYGLSTYDLPKPILQECRS